MRLAVRPKHSFCIYAGSGQLTVIFALRSLLVSVVIRSLQVWQNDIAATEALLEGAATPLLDAVDEESGW